LPASARRAYPPAGFFRDEDRMRITPTACIAAALLLPVSASAELNMKPGLWETATTVSGSPAPTEQKCYLQKDVDALDRFQRGQQPPGQNACTTSSYKALGNTMTYTLTCEFNGRKSVSAVTTTYDGDRITGLIAGADGTITRVLNTRIGDCAQSSFGN
jgi:uncharacterized protein DUF3617